MYATGQQQTLAWRDSRRSSNVSSSQYPSVKSMSDGRSGQPGVSTMDPPHQSDMWLPSDRPAGIGFSPPPLLTSESTAGTTGSNSSSVHYMPRTPLEPPLPVLQPSKPYENQLPPLRSISLSPQSSIDVSYNSPSGKAAPLPNVFPVSFSYDGWKRIGSTTNLKPLTNLAGIFVLEFPSAQPRRSYHQTYHPHTGSSAAVDLAAPIGSVKLAEEEVLDPVSALLKADEIVSRTSRNHPPP
jgi:hypothetical protein